MSVQILGKGKKVALGSVVTLVCASTSAVLAQRRIPELPRLVVTRSNCRHMVAQIIDDTKGVTLVSESVWYIALTSDFAGFEGTKTETADNMKPPRRSAN